MKLVGIFAPLTTPFAPDGSVAYSSLRENIARYNRTDLAGYAINGSTGESVLLRCDEIYRIWEEARNTAAPGKILIAGAGAEATEETIEHANRAAALGFDAALIRTPSFYKPAISNDLLEEHYLRVADAVRIPILIYSVPVFTHIKVEAPLVARLSQHPNIVGMKDSSGDVEGIANIIAASPEDFQLLAGSAATLHESLKVGSVGAILALACAFPDICVGIWKAAQTGDAVTAEFLQQQLMIPSKMLGVEYGISGLKYALDQIGYIGGSPRRPLLPLCESGCRAIDVMLSGFVSKNIPHHQFRA
jgi:4-hydroxy-2-oxoglutarate aldolase